LYKLVLILKYLRKRRLAWWSVLAVALCVTMVLVVMSVMGGWVQMFQESFHSISGDILIKSNRFQGMPYYQEIIDRIKAEVPEVKAAAPVLRTGGVVKIGIWYDRPDPFLPPVSVDSATTRAAKRPASVARPQIEKPLEVLGYPPNITEVNGFAESLYRLRNAGKLDFSLRDDVPYGPPSSNYRGDVHKWSGIIVGQGVIGIKRDRAGNIHRPDGMYQAFVYLTVMPQEVGASTFSLTDTVTEPFWIIDDSRTKVSQIDSNRVYVPFDKLQSMLRMQASDDDPARTHEIQIALKDGADLDAVRARVAAIVAQVRESKAAQTAYKRLGPNATPQQRAWAKEQELARLQRDFPCTTQTWREVHSDFLSVVGNEKILLAILLSLISLVAVFLVLCIFYMVVAEKTRDIGTIKAVGASSSGVATIFLGYGAVIGIIGGLLGLLFSYLFISNINQLHTWLGEKTGIVVWNPEFYLFDTIPSRMNPHEATIIVIVAIVSSIVGALVPAIRAARMNPVEALRWE
jgi:lipoprotein-releasing system permease protein